MEKRVTGLELLDEIRPAPPRRRFLQSWDADNTVLRYGCGDDKTAVVVGSDGAVDPSETVRHAKLRTSTVKKFLDGVQPEDPFGKVKAILNEYIYLPDDRLYSLFAAWIAGTYVYSMFSHFGYLFLFSDKPRCGKTRAEEVVSHLAFDATEPRNAPTPPSMRETVGAGGTAIFDTLERWKDKSMESYAAAMELLDAGFRTAGVVTKMVPAGPGEWRQELYPVYAPYMFAAIKRESLTDTALDRSFQIEMARKSTKEKKRRYDARCEAECEPIREQLYLFALTKASKIAEVYASAALQDEVDAMGLHDRAADIWKPLLAVATVIAEDDVANLEALALEMSPDEDRQEEFRQLRIVSALRTLAGPDGTLMGTSTQLTDRLKTITGVEASDLTSLLKEWKLEEKSLRLPEFDTPRKAFEITDAQLGEIEVRLRG